MIIRFLIRGGGIAIATLALISSILTYGLSAATLISSVATLALAVGATILFNRLFTFPPLDQLREIAAAVPDGPQHILVNDHDKLRFLAVRAKPLIPPRVLSLSRFADRDIDDSYSDYNTGETISTIPVEAFEIYGRAMVMRTMLSLVARFKRTDDGELFVYFERPQIGERPTTRRAVLRMALDQLAFHARSGIGRVTNEEIAELAAQLRGAHIDPDVNWGE